MRKRRWLVLALAGVVLVAGGLAGRRLWFSRPVGEGSAGPPVPREPFAVVWTTRPVVLLGIGDSVTAGFGASQGHSYFDRLVRNPEDELPDMHGISLSAVLPNLTVRNLAVSGSTSTQHLDVLREELQTHDPDTPGIVVMTTGGNDLIHWYGQRPPREGAMYGATLAQAGPWIENFEKRLHEMIDVLEDGFPGGCHIFVADIYDPTDGVGDAWLAGLPKWGDGVAIHRAYNEVIYRCAEQRASVHVVPMYEEFLGHGIHCTQFWREFYRPDDPHYWYGDNLEDPNDRGYDAIRRLFLIEIAKTADDFRRQADSKRQAAADELITH